MFIIPKPFVNQRFPRFFSHSTFIRFVLSPVNSVLAIADIELPKRLHYWEKEKNLYAKQVIVKKLKRRNIWGQCSIYKQIFLPPKLVVFPLELVDEVMLHEMTHLKYMHHRKQFWDYFSLLLGKDAKLYKIKENEFFTKYDDMIEFLLK